MIDLHTHSYCSDGQYSPAELVDRAYSLGVTTISLTDHDTVSGIAEAKHQAKKNNINFVEGIEISSEFETGKIHILGYNIDPNNKDLLDACKWTAEQRENRAKQMICVLSENGISISLDDVSRYSRNKLYVRPHFAHVLVNKGYVSNVREAFDKYLDTEYINNIKQKKLSLSESCQIIIGAGGIPVIAHPKKLKLSDISLESFILKSKQQGVMGLECFYSTHSSEETERFISLAKKYSLLVTCGSDFHGEKIKPDIRLGTGINHSLNGGYSDILTIS